MKLQFYKNYIFYIQNVVDLPGREYFIYKVFRKEEGSYSLVKEEGFLFYLSTFFEFLSLSFEEDNLILSFDDGTNKLSSRISLINSELKIEDAMKKFKIECSNYFIEEEYRISLDKASNFHNKFFKSNLASMQKIEGCWRPFELGEG